MKKHREAALRFAVCINNKGYEASLEFGKLYQVVLDAEATEHGYVTVIDESGAGYWYAAVRFFPLKVPTALARAWKTQSFPRARAREGEA
jgi:hypothetical protein